MRKSLLEKFVMEVTLSEIDHENGDGLAQAVTKSAKRRSEFHDQWKDKNPPRIAQAPASIHIRESLFKKLLKTAIIVEQETATPPVPDEQPPADQQAPATTASPAGAPGVVPPPAGTDPNAPPTPGIPGGTTQGAGVDPTTGAPLDTTMGGATTDATGGVGGGGGGFSFGGGGGGGGGGDTTTSPPAGGGGESDNTDTSASGGTDEENSGDPVSKIVDDAKELLDKTRDIPTILKSVKAVIQDKFEKPEHALGTVKALWDSGDSTLKAVAIRLYQFIQAKR